MKKQMLPLSIFLLFICALGALLFVRSVSHKIVSSSPTPLVGQEQQESSPLAIVSLRRLFFPSAVLHSEQSLPDGTGYTRSIVSYASENGIKIYALLTIPTDPMPRGGWPAIVFNHGYIPPQEYSTSNSYASYVDVFARHGYVVLKPDYRGNGRSQGEAEQSYVSPSYVIDDLAALASLQHDARVNPQKIGMWGHSMGGNITLHELVISHVIRAAVIWAGVVGSYPQLLQWWHYRWQTHSIVGNDLQTYNLLEQMMTKNGDIQQNPTFWHAIDPTNYLDAVSAPVQLHVGFADQTVPPSFSQSFFDQLKQNGKNVQLYTYPGDDHNISQNFSLAMQRSIAFFDKNLK